jgi:hypothetical protein
MTTSFLKYGVILGYCAVNFCQISTIHFNEKCLTIPNMYSKSEFDTHSSNSDDFSVHHCSVHYDLSLGGREEEYYKGPQPTALDLIQRKFID